MLEMVSCGYVCFEREIRGPHGTSGEQARTTPSENRICIYDVSALWRAQRRFRRCRIEGEQRVTLVITGLARVA